MAENEITKILVDIFIKVHTQLGPGLLESVYEEAIHHKILLTYLKLTNIKVGLLVNDNVNLVKDEIVRIVNNL